jgi:hypothetical protein
LANQFYNVDPATFFNRNYRREIGFHFKTVNHDKKEEIIKEYLQAATNVW